MKALKEIGLLFYLIPIWAALFVVDTMMKVSKYAYKKTHIAGEHLSKHVTKVMDDNNLK
jgi:hypothetical protein